MNHRDPAITLLGAAGEVTGSCTLLDTGAARVVVDFGLIQGSIHDELRNRDAPPIDWAAVDAVVLTHIHVDHCGRLGMLPKLGFRGTIWMTPPSERLIVKILRGSANLQQTRKVEWRDGTAPIARAIFPGDPDHLPEEDDPEPPVLFVNRDVSETSHLIRSANFGERLEIAPGVRLRFHPAGHVLGAASVELACGNGDGRDTIVVFSGDIGPQHNILLAPPRPPERADIVVLESTNGSREHVPGPDAEGQLEAVLALAAGRKERVLVPTFAIGRAQQLVYRLARLARRNALHGMNVYLDSTMAVRATEQFQHFRDGLAPEVRAAYDRGENPMHFPQLHYLTSREQSLKIADLKSGVILCGAGFMDAGPILHHLVRGIERDNVRILLAGYHPKGGLGDGLRHGAPRAEINGRIHDVRCQVSEVQGLSGHGEREDLVAWVRSMREPPRRIILNHGTDSARERLAADLETATGVRCELPFPPGGRPPHDRGGSADE